MRIIIHDLKNIDFLDLKEDDFAIDCNAITNCVGCFSCWIKHPLECISKDKIKNNGALLLKSDKLIIISNCINGCYSSKVKRVLERSISYVEPFFTLRNKEVHHMSRISKKLKFDIIFYGDITSCDKDIANKLVIANMNNLNSEIPNLHFIDDIPKIREII